MSLLVPVPTPGLLSINSPPSVQTLWHGVNTQSPREGDRMAQEADLLPKLPIALPATLAFPEGCRIKPHHSQGPGTGTAQPPSADQQHEICLYMVVSGDKEQAISEEIITAHHLLSSRDPSSCLSLPWLWKTLMCSATHQ